MSLRGRTGGSPNQRRGPLRAISAILTNSDSIFDPPRVRLECGHETHSWGQFKARCEKCAAIITCPHERLTEDGICRQCGADRRGI